jgi:glycosyltransferase involved in cell wall biosynthesis
MRLLYLYPEEWTGRRAREVHTLSTCAALARSGVNVTLVTAGGRNELYAHLRDVTGTDNIPGLQLAALSRSLGPIRSASFFAWHFRKWLRRQKPFDWGYIIHLKAAAMLTAAHLHYAYEAHEIFAETSVAHPAELHALESRVVMDSSMRIATSAPLAAALCVRYSFEDDFVIAPNAGLPPLNGSVAEPDGRFVYCGSIADWKGLDVVIQASREAQVPLKIVGGTAAEWQKLGTQLDTSGVAWQPRVPLSELPKSLAGACAGLIPTQPDTPSGRYSCPMKLFDYARCGLPVITTALPSLQSLQVGSWCTQVQSATPEAWADALRHFAYSQGHAEAARVWSGGHTWLKRAELLTRAFASRDVRG